MYKNKNDIKYLVCLWILLVLAIIPVYAHQGNILIDSGREVYYPTQILLGKVLYKDIFNIYGPYAYMFNAALFKIFGQNLNVLYLSGCISAFFIISLIYLISRKFLSEFVSFSITFFTICIGALNSNLFNFIFPYSYAMLYGLIAFLFSIFFLLKYQETTNNVKYLYLSSFFAGLSITSKYEFLPYIFVIIYAILKSKRLYLKQYCFAAIALLFTPIVCFGILFLQGLRIRDLVSTFEIIKNMANSQTLNYFYQAQGIYFNKQTIPFLLLNTFKTLLSFSLFYYGFNIKSKLFSVITICLSIYLIFYTINPASLLFIPIFIIILFILDFKNLIQNKSLMVLALSGIAVSLKVFWGLATLNYGAFFISFLLITLLALVSDKFKEKKLNYNIFAIYILIISIIFGYRNILSYKNKDCILTTTKGNIYLEKPLKESTNELIKYIKKNTKTTDRIIIFPEGIFINFLTDRTSDNYYNSMIPLYVESFGEDKFINYIKKTKPEYIIFSNLDMSKDYYFKNICSDYAQTFCSFVAKNYTQEKVIDNDFRYLIYKK